ncbi:hypothetical protein TIFTF001_046345 [Ficus carica]|uniref:Uncharacterized protein n=1 Tax=Ficus carica TaxID=3494 RepID=A0AA87Z4E1_FICCA|nr:hypothetical protein TIFTF001_046345 [Ficus carica]
MSKGGGYAETVQVQKAVVAAAILSHESWDCWVAQATTK